MASRKIYDAVATVGSYKDRNTGQEKKRYVNVGTVFESEDGRLSLKLDTIPVGPGWSSWIQFFEPSNRSGNTPPAQQPAPQQTTPGPDLEDEIPF